VWFSDSLLKFGIQPWESLKRLESASGNETLSNLKTLELFTPFKDGQSFM
jgi:hypothetical protein